ncbi:MAG: PAS domain S-box protein [Acidobacteria bacterium]|nr:PAS domain S-box protein [Acidobacteriota bacterium]
MSTESVDPRLIKRLELFSWATSLLAMLIGWLGLCGWLLHWEVLKNWQVGVAKMKFFSAVSFLLMGISLWLLRNREGLPANRRRAVTGWAAAGVVATIGFLSLGADLFDWKFVDDLFHFVSGVQSDRISIPTSSAFILLASALCTLHWKPRGRIWTPQFLCFAAIMISGIGLLAATLPASSPTGMSLPTSLALLLTALSIANFRPTWLLGGILVAKSPGGMLLRRVFPAVLLIMNLVGSLEWEALLTPTHLSWAEVVIVTLCGNLLLSMFILWTAFVLDVADQHRSAAARSLHESEQRLASIIASAMDAIITIDDQQRVILFNATAEKMFLCPAQAVIGQPIERFIPERFRPAHREHIRRFAVSAMNDPAMGRLNTLRALRSNGEEFPIDASVSQMSSEGRQLFTVILRDVSERVRAEEALAAKEEVLRTLLDGVQDYAIYMLDPHGRVASWNAGATRIKGYSPEEVIGQHFSIFYPEELRSQAYHHLQVALATGQYEDEGQRRRKDGSLFWAKVAILPIFHPDGSLRGFSKVLHDVTERHEMDKLLREQSRVMDLSQVLVRDPAGQIVTWSQGMSTLYGYSRDEAVGKISHELLHTEFSFPLAQIEAQLKREGRWAGELVHRKKDGSRVVVASVWVLHRDVEGRPTRVLEANTDITQLKLTQEQLAAQSEELNRQAQELARSTRALEEQTRLLQIIMDSMGEGMVAVDQNGKFVLWNSAATKILGIGPTHAFPSEWTGFYGLFLPDQVTPYPPEQLPLARAIRGEAMDKEMYVRNPALAEGVWLEVSGRPLRDDQGALCGGVAAFRDVTQRKLAGQVIQQLNEELEHRVKERTAQLETANKEMEAFTYSVSHDLRAPLRHIAGFAGILTEDFSSQIPPEARHYLDRIQEGTRRMGQLVDELLTLTRVGRQAVSLQVTGLQSVVEETISLLQPEAEQRDVQWKIGHLPFVECDPTLIAQVFQNLISNALKYSRPRPHTVIEIGQTRMDGQTVLFVRDNGVGFSMKYADKLFGVFQRLHRNEDFEGTGVGLATVQRIIQKHGGKIWAEAELDQGATFYFTLGPAEKANPMEAKAAVGA